MVFKMSRHKHYSSKFACVGNSFKTTAAHLQTTVIKNSLREADSFETGEKVKESENGGTMVSEDENRQWEEPCGERYHRYFYSHPAV